MPTVTKWEIRTNITTNLQVMVDFEHQPFEWYLVKVGVIASGRSEIVMGTI
jgi:hypothetical protein